MQVSSEEGQRMAGEIKAALYCECSAKSTEGVRDMFESAVRLTLYDRHGHLQLDTKTKSRKCCILQ